MKNELFGTTSYKKCYVLSLWLLLIGLFIYEMLQMTMWELSLQKNSSLASIKRSRQFEEPEEILDHSPTEFREGEAKNILS